jgi:putative phosphoribosyl transferase
MLKTSFKDLSGDNNALVLGIARGGIVLGDVVASRLSIDFDVIISQKLRDMDNKEVAIGATLEDGTTYLNEYFIELLEIPQAYVEKEKKEQLKEIQRRQALYRDNRPESQVKDKTVILVDDGVATGSTIIAAARWIRKRGPKYLIIATPVAQSKTMEKLGMEADEVIVVSKPSNFVTVGQFYQNFQPVEDEEIFTILKRRGIK